ncbi:hypothetical protein [Pseudonocardia sp.]|uniref:hypothetical protein n=1 Tax=Pseudonocardia sp. TaxID=60912 RepID=UPI002B4AED56|nr:hypothetical protein [Pseudonocardia sp.]
MMTSTGERIGYDTCFAPHCMRPLSLCTCPGGPTPPYLGPDAGDLTPVPGPAAPEAPLAA